MKLTVFAGTFNPIHVAHLILAEQVRTLLNLEKIVFIPSCVPPHREDGLAEAGHRLEMTRLAVMDNPYFELSDIEFKMEGKSYTVNTMKQLYKETPDIEGKINFITGTDAFLNIESWHKPEELVELVNFIVLARQGSPDAEEIASNMKFQNIDYTVVETPVINISSSYVRTALKEGRSIRYLVHDCVNDYIQDNKLYI